METLETQLDAIAAELAAGRLVPYLGPDVFDTGPEPPPFPTAEADLEAWLLARAPAPARIHGNLAAVAQYIESHRHRLTLTRLMEEAFAPQAAPTPLHRLLAAVPNLPLVVDTGYDATLARALAEAGTSRPVRQLTGVSRADVPGAWYRADGPEAAGTVLYKPHGCIRPVPAFLVSDADYVEVLTEIDIQTPIPSEVQALREGRGFLFLGCRFAGQLARTFARQVMKRSAGPHRAVVLPETLTRNEARFLEAQAIEPVACGLTDFVAALGDRLGALSAQA